MLHYTPDQQAAFDRWVDIAAQLLQKYGPSFIESQKERSKDNNPQVLSSTNDKHDSLESFQKAA